MLFYVTYMKYYIFIAISILLGVIGQIVLKLGSSSVSTSSVLSIFSSFLNPYIIGGLFCYGVSAFFWVLALTRLDLSTAYPLLSISYVLVTLSAYFFLGESLNIYKIVGITIIILGVILMGQKL